MGAEEVVVASARGSEGPAGGGRGDLGVGQAGRRSPSTSSAQMERMVVTMQDPDHI